MRTSLKVKLLLAFALTTILPQAAQAGTANSPELQIGSTRTFAAAASTETSLRGRTVAEGKNFTSYVQNNIEDFKLAIEKRLTSDFSNLGIDIPVEKLSIDADLNVEIPYTAPANADGRLISDVESRLRSAVTNAIEDMFDEFRKPPIVGTGGCETSGPGWYVFIFAALFYLMRRAWLGRRRVSL